MNQQQLNKIDEEFDKLFSNELEFKTSSQLEWYEVGEIKNIILDFIHSKLQEAIEGEREKIIKVIEIFMQNSTCCYDNPCIEEIINKIKSLQTNKE